MATEAEGLAIGRPHTRVTAIIVIAICLRPMTAAEVEEGMTVVEGAETAETAEEMTETDTMTGVETEEIWALNAPAAESALRVKLEARAVSAGVVTWDRTSIIAITCHP